MQQPEQSDVELMRAIARRDQGALEVLYRRYGGRIKAVALYIVRDEAIAEEVVQDVFVNACWRDAKKYDPETGRSVIGWLLVATAMGVQICDQPGRVNLILPPIPVARFPSNLCFAGPYMKTLYVTAGDKVFKRQTKLAGIKAWEKPDMPPKPGL